MAKYITDPIILPDDHSWQDLEDAKLSAKWRKVKSREEIQSRTDLSGKCGSCKHFIPYRGKLCCRGDCDKGRAGFRQRCTKACKLYEKKRGK